MSHRVGIAESSLGMSLRFTFLRLLWKRKHLVVSRGLRPAPPNLFFASNLATTPVPLGMSRRTVIRGSVSLASF